MLPDPNPSLTPTLTLADQVVWMVDVFLKILAPEACKQRIGLLSCAIWNRVRRLERRFCSLYAEWKAGTLPKGVRRRRAARRCERGVAQGEATVERPASLMPRRVRWMYALLPMSAGTLLGRLDSLLHHYPEMKAFVAQCPQAGRVLRALCGTAGLTVPGWLALARRRRSSPRRGEGERHPSPVPSLKGRGTQAGAEKQRTRRGRRT